VTTRRAAPPIPLPGACHAVLGLAPLPGNLPGLRLLLLASGAARSPDCSTATAARGVPHPGRPTACPPETPAPALRPLGLLS
jgi:hypothetical protein